MVKKQFKYIESFDTLRGLGTILVMIIHGSYDLLPGGLLPVDIFFVLSGFLITTLLQNEFDNKDDISFGKFYARRAIRLLPPLVIGVIIGNILWDHQIVYPQANRLLATTSALFYFSNLLGNDICGNLLHFWSLSVEEHFYFFWPVLALFLFRISFRRRILFMGLLILAVTIFKIFVFNSHLVWGVFTIDSFRFTFCKMDVILVGALLSFLMKKLTEANIDVQGKTKINILIFSLLCAYVIVFTCVSETNKYWGNGGFILTNLLCAVIIYVAIRHSEHYLFSGKIFRWAGKRSYGLYVYHFPIFNAFEELREHHSIRSFFVINFLRFSISIAVAALSYKYVEMPLLRYKRKFEVKKEPVNDTNPIAV